MSKVVKVLSIDGGGIRGIIPATILAEIEKRTNKPVSTMFDLIAGTSTGGVLALGLAKPGHNGKAEFAAKDLVQLYELQGHIIFSRSIWRMIRSVGNLIDEKYPSSHIEEILEDYFGNSMLKDSLTNVLVTSYEIERRFPFFFKSKKAQSMNEYDFLMREIARATTAAPTYFEPYKLKCIDPTTEYFSLIDGGVYANNPAMCAYVEARTLYPDADDIMLVSIGTGEMVKRIPHSKAEHWGLAQWAQPMLNIMFDGVSDTVDYQLQQLLTVHKKEERMYYRFQGRLESGNENLDNSNEENIRNLKLIAEDVVRINSDSIDVLCKELVK